MFDPPAVVPPLRVVAPAGPVGPTHGPAPVVASPSPPGPHVVVSAGPSSPALVSAPSGSSSPAPAPDSAPSASPAGPAGPSDLAGLVPSSAASDLSCVRVAGPSSL